MYLHLDEILMAAILNAWLFQAKTTTFPTKYQRTMCSTSYLYNLHWTAMINLGLLPI